MSSLLHPLPRCLPLPPSSDFPSTHGFTPPPPLLPPFPLPGRLLLSYGPGVGVGVPPPSGVTTSLVNSMAMRVLLHLPLLLMLLPPLGLPIARLPPPPFQPALLGDTADPLLLAASPHFSGCYTCLS